MAPKCKCVTHCIFDLDGTILDTGPYYKYANQKILAEYGKTFTLDAFVQSFGLHQNDLANYFVDTFNLPLTPGEYILKYNDNSVDFLPDVDLLPGADRLVRHFHRQKVPMALTTSFTQLHFEAKTDAYEELCESFQHKVFGSNDPAVKKGKPAPDIFLVAASRFLSKPKPESCLVFEASPVGVAAALEAGMQVVMITSAEIPCSISERATQRMTSLQCFDPDDFGLPGFYM